MKFILKPGLYGPRLSQTCNTMKLIALLLLAAITQVHAESYAQSITIHQKNIPVEKVLLLIEKQSNYHFIYDSRLSVIKNGTVDLNIENGTVAAALDQCLGNLPVTYTIIQQTITIKGNDLK